ncbi:hypothetical protein BS78_03G180000 [Paspalum vaginatum]|nr:hypothetical protein BS78_03G180000 [Paspalum vaginatum]
MAQVAAKVKNLVVYQLSYRYRTEALCIYLRFLCLVDDGFLHALLKHQVHVCDIAQLLPKNASAQPAAATAASSRPGRPPLFVRRSVGVGLLESPVRSQGPREGSMAEPKQARTNTFSHICINIFL